MKIYLDKELVWEITDHHLKVLKDGISEDILIEDIKRRLRWVIEHKYEHCLKELKQTWDPILKKSMESIPTNIEVYCDLVLAQPEYKDRAQRLDQINMGAS